MMRDPEVLRYEVLPRQHAANSRAHPALGALRQISRELP
jgi:hypothetical protein